MAKVRFVVVILSVLFAMLSLPNIGGIHAAASTVLVGEVSSQEEGLMEGVLVSAKKQGSTVTVTVVTDSHGHYDFPQARLSPGVYVLSTRAAGYDLNDPGPVELTASKTTRVNLKLVKTKDLAAQLTNTEWLLSAPGTQEQKMPLLQCVNCHRLERIFRSHFNADEFRATVHRMGTYDAGSSPERPQKAPAAEAQLQQRFANISPEYLTTINLSSVTQWQYPLKTLPRPKGKATRVIITEYDLPRRNALPHDAIVDSLGFVWYSDHGQQFLGRLDPKTANVVEYQVPLLRPDFPTGYRVIWLDREENIWLSMAAQGAVAKFDRKTEKFQVWNVPGLGGSPRGVTMVQPGHMDVDGKLWVQLNLSKIQRLDVKTGEWEHDTISVFGSTVKNSPAPGRPHGVYDTISDSQNNLYFTDFGSEYIGRVDAKTLKLTYYETPTFNSGPRRGHVDQQDRLWFGEDKSGKIGVFDPKTERIQEWANPTPFNTAYDAIPDKNGDVWAGGMMSDRVSRLNPTTGEVIEYLLPRPTNIRKVDVDNSTNPVTFWVASRQGASIIKLEPLE